MKPYTITEQPTDPEEGKDFHMTHSRFGTALVTVKHLDNDWADIEILQGTLRGRSPNAVWAEGMTKAVRVANAVWRTITYKA